MRRRRYQRNRKNSGQTRCAGGANANFAVGNLIISFRTGEFKDFIKSRLKCRRRVSTHLKNFITLFTTFLSRLSVSTFSSLLHLFSFLYFADAPYARRGRGQISENGSRRDGRDTNKTDPLRPLPPPPPSRTHPPE